MQESLNLTYSIKISKYQKLAQRLSLSNKIWKQCIDNWANQDFLLKYQNNFKYRGDNNNKNKVKQTKSKMKEWNHKQGTQWNNK